MTLKDMLFDEMKEIEKDRWVTVSLVMRRTNDDEFIIDSVQVKYIDD